MPITSRRRAGFRLITSAALASVALILGACATVPEAPHAALTEARTAINTAEKDNAAHYASPVLVEARLRLAQADSAVASQHMLEADRLAHQSRIAAELASARTEAAKAAEVNNELAQSADALYEEMERAGDRQ